MDAVIIVHDPAGAGDCGADADLYCKELYFKLVIIVVFEDEGSRPRLMNQI
jgi:hypothetical protein